MCSNNIDDCLVSTSNSVFCLGAWCTIRYHIVQWSVKYSSNLSTIFQATLMLCNWNWSKEIPQRHWSGLVFSVYRSQGNNPVTEGSLGFNMLLTQIKDPAWGRIGLFMMFATLQQEWSKEEVSRGINTLADTKTHLFNNDQILAEALFTS